MKGSSGRPTDIECESSDEEEEYTSDECEDDDEDVVELDISINAIKIVTTSGSPSVPSSVAAAVGPASVSPPLAAGSGQSTPSPNIVVGSVPEDAVSLQEGGGSFYESTLPEVWINSDKIEPAQASQFITRTIQAHFSGPIHRFNDFPIEVQELLYQMFMSNHRFMHRSDKARSRLVWTMTARSNVKNLLYNARKNAHKVSRSADPTLWRERAPTWMRRDYWETLCNIWATERWQQTSTIMKVNRAANPEANMHTSGSVSFATHQSRLEKELKWPPTFQEVFDKTHKKKGIDQYISDRAREVAESYSQQMTEKYAGEEEQPRLDPEVWVAASGAPKKGHVYGFGHSMNTSMVLSGASSSASQTSAFSTPAGAAGTSPSEMMGFIADTISGLESRLAETMETRLVQMQMQVTDALQAQLSHTLSQVISQALSQVSIPP
ncbi:hypothetical protein Taro_006583 [Colocasia esculenta]|uniref:Uncharacterized protein n=1 Tax=Colocasia esculenta TaxID=4460 RepID=A0A843TWD9_COLES|nr:hypothetical protein [Colocasia esculenta]